MPKLCFGDDGLLKKNFLSLCAPGPGVGSIYIERDTCIFLSVKVKKRKGEREKEDRMFLLVVCWSDIFVPPVRDLSVIGRLLAVNFRKAAVVS